MSDLTIPQRDALASVRRIRGMSEAERKRLAAKAVHERDHETLWEVTRAFLEPKQPSKHTLRAYRKGILQLLDAWLDTDLLRATPNEAELYIFNLASPDRAADEQDLHHETNAKSKPLSASSIRSRIAAARALYRALRWTGVTNADPFKDASLPSPDSSFRERVKEKAWTQDELVAMIHVVSPNREDPGDPEALTILLLGAHAGLRASEMVNLRWEHVNLHKRKLKIVEGKGNKTASVRMSRMLARHLHDMRIKRNPDQPHVLTIRSQSQAYRRLQRHWPAAMQYLKIDQDDIPDFEGKGVHGLRHYCGVRMARESGIMVARDHLRHSSVQTTEIYAGIAEESTAVDDW